MLSRKMGSINSAVLVGCPLLGKNDNKQFRNKINTERQGKRNDVSKKKHIKWKNGQAKEMLPSLSFAKRVWKILDS